MTAGETIASVRIWLASVALAAPAAVPYLVHYLSAGDHAATGFILPDMASYMAHAREYFDAGGLTYGNPFSPSYETPSIYFQPWTLLLGVVWRLTELDPGLVFVGFGAVAAIVCTRIAISLYQRFSETRDIPGKLGLIAFLWGGGVLVLTGLAYNVITGQPEQSVFRFDPGGGWWFLSFGRNFVFPTEAFFHVLFLGCVLAVLSGRFKLAWGVALLTAMSHPFTGVQLLLVLSTWACLEWFFIRSGEVPAPFLVGCFGLLVLTLGYYIGFLGRFPEHRELMQHWAQPWVYHAESFIPAYALVGGLAAWRLRRLESARNVLASPGNRLLLAWFAVSFALANHEFAIEPVQPLHFTRGYVWIPLFLLGAPLLVQQLGRLWSSRRLLLGPALALVIVGLFLADNAAWLARLTRQPPGVYVTSEERELLTWLDQPRHEGAILLAERGELGYLATVHTPLRAWHSHPFNTPWSYTRLTEARAFFQEGTFLEDWRRDRVLVVYEEDPAADLVRGFPPDVTATTRFRNRAFTVVEVDAGPGPASSSSTEAGRGSRD